MTEKMKEAITRVFDLMVEEAPNAVRATIKFEPGAKCTVEIETAEHLDLLFVQKL